MLPQHGQTWPDSPPSTWLAPIQQHSKEQGEQVLPTSVLVEELRQLTPLLPGCPFIRNCLDHRRVLLRRYDYGAPASLDPANNQGVSFLS